jgi:hypothetical protein
MDKNSVKIGFVVAVLLWVIIACGVSASTANIKDAKMALDPDGNQPTTVFSPEATFYCVVDLANAPDDTVVKAVWTAAQVEDVEPDFYLGEKDITLGSGRIHFELSNDNLWPTGKYKVDLYLNGELDRTLEFEVR